MRIIHSYRLKHIALSQLPCNGLREDPFKKWTDTIKREILKRIRGSAIDGEKMSAFYYGHHEVCKWM